MKKQCKNNPAIAGVLNKQIFELDVNNHTQDHYDRMKTIVDDMQAMRQPFQFTIIGENNERRVATGDFDSDGEFNITCKVSGYNNESGMLSLNLSRLWSVRIHNTDGKTTKVETVMSAWCVQSVAADLITEARKKKDMSKIALAEQMIADCERLGQPIAATPRKALFSRITTAKAWISRQPPKRVKLAKAA